MTDYFALLNQPRRPWLDPEQLKETFHAKTLQAHPDAQSRTSTSSEAAFADINEAYQVLRDPKRRLHHLLSLEGNPPLSQSSSVPAEIAELFPVIADLILEADGLAQKIGGATNSLSRSLLKPQQVAITERIRETVHKLTALDHEAQSRLKQVSESNERGELHMLYLRFSYLTKWIAQLEEKQLSLAL